MKYFKQLPYSFDSDKLEKGLEDVLQICPWKNNGSPWPWQICLTERQHEHQAYYSGNGGAMDIIDKKGKEVNHPGNMKESDYTKFMPEFANTYLKHVYDTLLKDLKIGRVRLFLSKPKKAIPWHRDFEPRVHIPIITLPGARMVIDDEVHHMEAGTCWFADTRFYHSQFNGSEADRIHMVMTIIQ